MKRILYIAVAVLVLTRLIDFVFYGAHAHDLVGANVIAACGIALVLGSFVLEWKVFG